MLFYQWLICNIILRHAIILFSLFLLSIPGRSQHDLPCFDSLANRFRPYLKFSVYRNMDEQFKPCSWPWFYKNSVLKFNNQVVADEINMVNLPRFSNSRAYDLNDSLLRLSLVPKNDKIFFGEDWPEILQGNGIYAHVSVIDSVYLNIEYWILYAFNKSTRKKLDHIGDLTAIQLLYNRVADRISYISFSIHGKVIEQFDAGAFLKSEIVTLTGKNALTGLVSLACFERKTIDRKKILQNGPFWYGKSENVLYFARDSLSMHYEHPVVFIEWGAHEPWPNQEGSVWFAPGHNGAGYSFLPGNVALLAEPDSTFTRFAGILGTDPVSISRHRFWYPGEKDIMIPDKIKSDRNPYQYYESKGITNPGLKPGR